MAGNNRIEHLESLLNAPDQTLHFQFIVVKLTEWLETGNGGRLIIDVQHNRINGLQVNEFIAGSTQTAYYLDKSS